MALVFGRAEPVVAGQPEEISMWSYKLISADSHIVEPPDLYSSRFEPKLRERAPRMERHKTPAGREFDAWMLDGMQVGTLGAVLQPSQGLFWYRIRDGKLLSEICRVYNDWIADFCKPYPDRLKGIAMLNVDDVDDACQELERCAKLGLVGAFIPVAPLPEFPYRHPIYERLWWTAQDLNQPLLLHISTPRFGVPANEFTTDSTEMTASGRSTTDYWVRYSMGAMLFAGVFDRYPRLKIGSVEHEASWIPHWLKQMDFVYTERPVFTKGWKSREGLLPSEYWRRNMFVEFMEDDIGVKLRDYIGVETMLWGSDYPHAEATFPRSQQFLARMFDGVSDADLRKITSENAAKMFGFTLN